MVLWSSNVSNSSFTRKSVFEIRIQGQQIDIMHHNIITPNSICFEPTNLMTISYELLEAKTYIYQRSSIEAERISLIQDYEFIIYILRPEKPLEMRNKLGQLYFPIAKRHQYTETMVKRSRRMFPTRPGNPF